jgi:hypothetical protein
MTSTSNTLSVRANVQRISLLLGIITVADVVTWADAEIMASDVPPSELIDLSLGSSNAPPKMVSLLSSLVSDSTERDSLKHVFRDVAGRIRAGSLEAGTAIQSIVNYLKSDQSNRDLLNKFEGLNNRESLLKELDGFASS